MRFLKAVVKDDHHLFFFTGTCIHALNRSVDCHISVACFRSPIYVNYIIRESMLAKEFSAFRKHRSK